MVHVRTLGKTGQRARRAGLLANGIALHDGKLWVADTDNHRIQALDKDTGECVATMGEHGEEEGKLSDYPFGIAIAPTAGLVSCENLNLKCVSEE